MAGAILWTQAELEAELGAEVVLQLLDDDNDGVVDEEPLRRLQESSAAYVTSGIERIYPTLVGLIAEWQADPLLEGVPPKLKQLGLDYAVATLTKRNPSYVRRDWRELMDHVDKQIERIRKTGLDSLGVSTPPEPAANQGGIIESESGSGEEPTKFFTGPCGLGDF